MMKGTVKFLISVKKVQPILTTQMIKKLLEDEHLPLKRLETIHIW